MRPRHEAAENVEDIRSGELPYSLRFNEAAA